MSVFTEAEIAYLKTQPLGRLATTDANGQPHVVPVAFRYNSDLDTLDIGGHDFAKRKKFRDAQKNPQAALVIDDIESFNPWKVRGLEVRGKVEILETGGETIRPGFDAQFFRLRPTRLVSWGLEPNGQRRTWKA